MKREVWIDWLRVAACFMVMVVHSTEPFYLGGEGSLILTKADAYWTSFFDTLVRACVPLFVVASSYLQFPIHYSTGEFLRRRAIRILVPFLIWSLFYAFYWGEPVDNLRSLLLNFNYAAGHLWFVYMLLGLYLLMPILSPWAERVSKRELQGYLFLCFLTTLVPLIRAWASWGASAVIYGPTGIPNKALYPLWGECSWNAYGLFYYFSGFIGYMLLGLYLRRFVGELSWKRTLTIALPSWFLGFIVCFGGFILLVMADTGGHFPIEGPTGLAAVWETMWINDTVGVLLMTIGWLLLFKKLNASGWFYQRILLPISKASYGIYLCHMVALSFFSRWLRHTLGIGSGGRMGIFTTPLEIILAALLAFIVTALFCVLVRRIPKWGKWLIG